MKSVVLTGLTTFIVGLAVSSALSTTKKADAFVPPAASAFARKIESPKAQVKLPLGKTIPNDDGQFDDYYGDVYRNTKGCKVYNLTTN